MVGQLGGCCRDHGRWAGPRRLSELGGGMALGRNSIAVDTRPFWHLLVLAQPETSPLEAREHVVQVASALYRQSGIRLAPESVGQGRVGQPGLAPPCL